MNNAFRHVGIAAAVVVVVVATKLSQSFVASCSVGGLSCIRDD